jgi:hypothetical protein
MVREKDNQLVVRQWSNKDSNDKHLYSSLESAKNLYIPFGLEKVNIYVGEGENAVTDHS